MLRWLLSSRMKNKPKCIAGHWISEEQSKENYKSISQGSLYFEISYESRWASPPILTQQFKVLVISKKILHTRPVNTIFCYCSYRKFQLFPNQTNTTDDVKWAIEDVHIVSVQQPGYMLYPLTWKPARFSYCWWEPTEFLTIKERWRYLILYWEANRCCLLYLISTNTWETSEDSWVPFLEIRNQE